MEDISDWRIGHYEREVTEDYIQSLIQGKNLIHDEEFAKLFDEVMLKTQVPVWDKERINHLLFTKN